MRCKIVEIQTVELNENELMDNIDLDTMLESFTIEGTDLAGEGDINTSMIKTVKLDRDKTEIDISGLTKFDKKFLISLAGIIPNVVVQEDTKILATILYFNENQDKYNILYADAINFTNYITDNYLANKHLIHDSGFCERTIEKLNAYTKLLDMLIYYQSEEDKNELAGYDIKEFNDLLGASKLFEKLKYGIVKGNLIRRLLVNLYSRYELEVNIAKYLADGEFKKNLEYYEHRSYDGLSSEQVEDLVNIGFLDIFGMEEYIKSDVKVVGKMTLEDSLAKPYNMRTIQSLSNYYLFHRVKDDMDEKEVVKAHRSYIASILF